MTRSFAFLTAVLIAAGCSARIQQSSGADYLARYDAAEIHSQNQHVGRTDDKIREAAAVEPILRFPARFGLARIVNGQLTSVPAEEATLWRELAEKHGHLGEFVPVDPLVATFTARAMGTPQTNRWNPDIGQIVETIRLGAARQHVDAVLIYELGATSQKENTFIGFADLTIIGGAILPTRSIEAAGLARALLMDVRNGYPYGSTHTMTDLSTLSPSWGSDARETDLKREAMQVVAKALVPEVDRMLVDLTRAMQARRMTTK